MASWGVVNADDALQVPAASGGVQMTDRIELAEYRAKDDDLSVPLFIRVAGTRYYPASEHVQPEMDLQLVREPGNAEDAYATMLCTTEGQIGYVPQEYSQNIARALDAGQSLRAVAVRWQAVPAVPRRLVVRLSRV